MKTLLIFWMVIGVIFTELHLNRLSYKLLFTKWDRKKKKVKFLLLRSEVAIPTPFYWEYQTLRTLILTLCLTHIFNKYLTTLIIY